MIVVFLDIFTKIYFYFFGESTESKERRRIIFSLLEYAVEKSKNKFDDAALEIFKKVSIPRIFKKISEVPDDHKINLMNDITIDKEHVRDWHGGYDLLNKTIYLEYKGLRATWDTKDGGYKLEGEVRI